MGGATGWNGTSIANCGITWSAASRTRIQAGLSEPEARRQASIEFGGVPQVQEAVRDAWTSRWLDDLVGDVRYAIRTLTRSWGFALGAGAVLALAIGANVAIFSVVNAVLLQPLPYPDAERLVSVETLWTNTGRASQDVSGPDFLDWQARNDVFETMAVSNGGDNDGDVPRPSSAIAPCSPTPDTSRRSSLRSSASPRLRDAC